MRIQNPNLVSLRWLSAVCLIAVFLGACNGQSDADNGAGTAPAGDRFDVVPGLGAKILRRGYGRQAEPGDFVDVHYTGWLYDPAADGVRGSKFDSSVDRGERFQFTLGAGQVIRGWDQGVDGMLVGEVRELTIAPELAYGSRGFGKVIPPNSTLVFEIQLFGAEPPPEPDR